jgi:PAS domain S-box-containing protein
MSYSSNQYLEGKSVIPFKGLVNSLPQLVFVLDAKGDLIFVNDYCETLLGYKARELMGKPIMDIIVGREQKSIQYLLSSCASNDTSMAQHHFLKKNGTEIVIEWSAKWNAYNQLWYCCSRAISKATVQSQMQLHYEKKVKEHNKRLSSLLERIGEGFMALDEEGRVIYWNKQAELISGKPREEMLSRKIWESYPETTAPEFRSFYSKAIEEQTYQQYEAYYSNEGKWIEMIIHPGNNGVTAFFRDITEQKKIEEELEVQKKQVTKKVTAAVIQAQEKERTQISQELHDNVNQVLTTVKLYIELCTNDMGNKELMQRSMSLLQACIDEIRSLSKQLSAPSLGKISLKDSVKDLVKTMTATGKTKIQLNTKAIKDIPVDKELHLAIYRILQEHLTNIMKHAEAKKVRIVINYLDDDIILKVSDDGKGFDPAHAANGIGIDNMTSRAESLGGKLTINSAPGLGCVLIAHFPKN